MHLQQRRPSRLEVCINHIHFLLHHTQNQFFQPNFVGYFKPIYIFLDNSQLRHFQYIYHFFFFEENAYTKLISLKSIFIQPKIYEKLVLLKIIGRPPISRTGPCSQVGFNKIRVQLALDLYPIDILNS